MIINNPYVNHKSHAFEGRQKLLCQIEQLERVVDLYLKRLLQHWYTNSSIINETNENVLPLSFPHKSFVAF